jgi:hypothetical protein
MVKVNARALDPVIVHNPARLLAVGEADAVGIVGRVQFDLLDPDVLQSAGEIACLNPRPLRIHLAADWHPQGFSVRFPQ